MPRLDWSAIVERAAEIVSEYDTGVTLRQLHYRLVSEHAIPNSPNAYKRLSSLTAEARRAGTFPALIDRGRRIHRNMSFGGVDHAMRTIINAYRRDRTEGQEVSLYLGVEKGGMVEQLTAWFGEPLGIPVLALGGYSSQTYVDTVIQDVERSNRPAILLYAGDHDPSGEDIDRDYAARTDCWEKVVRVALSSTQVQEYRLPPNPGKIGDSRAAGFIARHGELVQVELDALDPNDLRRLYSAAIDQYWDTSAYEEAIEREEEERTALAELRPAA